MSKFVNMKIIAIILALVFVSCGKEYTEPVETKKSLGMHQAAADVRLPYLGHWQIPNFCMSSVYVEIEKHGSSELIINKTHRLQWNGSEYANKGATILVWEHDGEIHYLASEVGFECEGVLVAL